MCHLCRKLETLKLDSKTIKLIVALISILHKKIEPHLGDFWLQRYEQTVKLQTFLTKLHNTLPLTTLLAMLDNIDRELDHILKNMPDHTPQLSAGRLDLLKEVIAPGSSASCPVVPRTPGNGGQERNDTQEAHKRRRLGSRKCLAASPDTAEGRNLPELPGSDLAPPAARMRQSIRKVEEWFRRCEDANKQERKWDKQLAHPEASTTVSMVSSRDARHNDQGMPEPAPSSRRPPEDHLHPMILRLSNIAAAREESSGA